LAVVNLSRMKETTPPILETRSLSFRFPDSQTTLLHKVDWVISDHESVALLGPTGCGKSVLLKLIAGLLRPNAGEVLFCGKPISKMSSVELRTFRRAMGMTFQKDGLFDSLSAGDNLRLPLWEVERVSGRQADKRIDAALESVELKGTAALKVYELSGGMQKRLGIARALLFQPSVVLYDEPTAGLDPITSKNILDLIQRHREESRATIVLVSSQPDQVERATDGATFLWNSHLEGPKTWSQWKAGKYPAVRQFLSGSLEGPLTVEGGFSA
jgi:phospholipid/cholesterol/gamma-HCH transport system ATP-binding protein